MNAEHVWAVIGVLCLITLFAMLLLGIRNAKNESFALPDSGTEGGHE
jgi:hypothetical protein